MLTDNMKGALIMALSMAFFTLNDTFMTLMAGEVPLYQIPFSYTHRTLPPHKDHYHSFAQPLTTTKKHSTDR